MKIYFDNNQIIEIENNISVSEFITKYFETSVKQVVLAEVNGKVVNLSHLLKDEDKVKLITLKDKEGINAYRRTLVTIFAHAVKEIYPTCCLGEAKLTDTGFYYDVAFKTPIKSDDLQTISGEMKKIIKSDMPIEVVKVDRENALDTMRKFKEMYKMQILENTDSDYVYFNLHGGFTELSIGSILSSTGKCKNFILSKMCGAYWKGDRKNKMLTRITCVAFEKKSQIDEYNAVLQENESNGHVKLGRKLGYYTLSNDIGQGLPIILGKGEIVIRTLINDIQNREYSRGLIPVRTPIIAKSSFFKKSSHFEKIKDTLFSSYRKNKDAYLMRAEMYAFHFETYLSHLRSYRELPVRYSETASCFRKENSGQVKGLVRLSQHTVTEETIICTKSQLKSEVASGLDFLLSVMDSLGFLEDIVVRLGVRGKDTTKYLTNSNEWTQMENLLRAVLEEKGISYVEKTGGATYYAPKIDILIKNSFRKEEEILSLLLDAQLPKQCKLKYTDKNNAKKTPYAIHIVGIGGYEKILAYLIEKHKGNMPLWLSPVTVSVVNVSKKTEKKAVQIVERLTSEGLRAVVDIRNETLSKKIRDNHTQKIPYTIIVGENEGENQITVRKFGSRDISTLTLDEFIVDIKEKISKKQ